MRRERYVGEILVRRGALPADRLDDLLRAAEEKEVRLLDLLLAAREVEPESLVRALADEVAIPFGYAKRHGVVVEPSAGERPRVLCRGTPPVPVLAELRRALGRRFSLVEGDAARFDEALAAA